MFSSSQVTQFSNYTRFAFRPQAATDPNIDHAKLANAEDINQAGKPNASYIYPFLRPHFNSSFSTVSW